MRQVAHAAEPGLEGEAGVDSKDEVHIFGKGKTYMRESKDEEAQVPVKLRIWSYLISGQGFVRFLL